MYNSIRRGAEVLIRGTYLDKKALENQQIFPIKVLDKSKIKSGFISKLIESQFPANFQIDTTTGYIIQGIHEMIPTLYRYKMKVYLTTEIFHYDRLFIDNNKGNIVFMNSENGDIRRVNPSKIQLIVFEEIQRFSIKL